MYAHPDKDGFFWGPRLELQVAMGKSGNPHQISVGSRQWAPGKGQYSVTALWIHVIHQEELKREYEGGTRLHFNVDDWRPEFLVP